MINSYINISQFITYLFNSTTKEGILMLSGISDTYIGINKKLREEDNLYITRVNWNDDNESSLYYIKTIDDFKGLLDILTKSGKSFDICTYIKERFGESVYSSGLGEALLSLRSNDDETTKGRDLIKAITYFIVIRHALSLNKIEGLDKSFKRV